MLKRTMMAACVALAAAGCAAGNPPYAHGPGIEGSSTGEHPAVGAPASGSPAGTTEGPHEGSRASVPPGKSRDGQPPAGGAIVDPAGAATGTAPPPGIR